MVASGIRVNNVNRAGKAEKAEKGGKCREKRKGDTNTHATAAGRLIKTSTSSMAPMGT